MRMMDALPAEVAAKYERPRQVFREEKDLPKDFRGLCRRYSTLRGQRREWVAYLKRPVARDLWVLAPEEYCLATVSVA